MPVYQRETRVRAPFEEVWSFHSEVSGLEALTPEFMHLDVESVVGPDGEFDPEVLAAGSAIEMSMQPFGVGPRQRWTSRIREREQHDNHHVHDHGDAEHRFGEGTARAHLLNDGDGRSGRQRQQNSRA